MYYAERIQFLVFLTWERFSVSNAAELDSYVIPVIYTFAAVLNSCLFATLTHAGIALVSERDPESKNSCILRLFVVITVSFSLFNNVDYTN